MSIAVQYFILQSLIVVVGFFVLIRTFTWYYSQDYGKH